MQQNISVQCIYISNNRLDAGADCDRELKIFASSSKLYSIIFDFGSFSGLNDVCSMIMALFISSHKKIKNSKFGPLMACACSFSKDQSDAACNLSR
jgi:hypothetical protein